MFATVVLIPITIITITNIILFIYSSLSAMSFLSFLILTKYFSFPKTWLKKLSWTPRTFLCSVPRALSLLMSLSTKLYRNYLSEYLISLCTPAPLLPSCKAVRSWMASILSFSICSLALMHSCVRGPQDHPQVQWCTRRAHRTQFIVAFMTMINYSEMWHKAKSAKGKGAWGRDQRKPGIRVQESSLCVESQRTNFSPFPHGTVITQANCCQPGKLIGYSLLQVDTGSRLHRYSLSSQ